MSIDPQQSPERPESTSSTQQDLPGSFGRYQIERLLGQGGMGRVYLAHDPKKGRRVALKVMARETATNPTLLKRFRAEALATRELQHENIVGVYEAGSINHQFYIALEYIDGTDVSQLIVSRGPLPVQRSLEIIRQTAAALEQAHIQGIVHRDIKPSNILIRRDGVVKLTDMGLARSTDDANQSRITRAGTTVGTVDYISPEQARDSSSADTRSDIYSLGCSWYHMLTGQAIFPDGTLTEKLRHHAATPPPDARIINESISGNIAVVLERMLAKDPDRRYQDPTQLIAALDGVEDDREDLSIDILAGLAEGDNSLSPTTTPPPPAAPRPARSRAASPPPSPRSRRTQRRPDADEQTGPDWSTLKPIGLLMFCLLLVLLCGWFLFNLSQSLDVSERPDGLSVGSVTSGATSDIPLPATRATP